MNTTGKRESTKNKKDAEKLRHGTLQRPESVSRYVVRYLVFAISIKNLARGALNEKDKSSLQLDKDFAESAILCSDPPDCAF